MEGKQGHLCPLAGHCLHLVPQGLARSNRAANSLGIAFHWGLRAVSQGALAAQEGGRGPWPGMGDK